MNPMARVVLVGRMNVGKSTLFNRLSKNVKSLTLDYAGVTRDFLKDTVSWNDCSFTLIDTGGVSLRKTEDPILLKVQEMVFGLIEQADLVLFVCDGSSGFLTEDREIAKILHKKGRPVLIVINKADRKDTQDHAYEFDSVGFPQVLVSAEHGTGVNDLLDAVLATEGIARGLADEEPADQRYKVTLLGKPNVGKSSLLNSLLQEERALVADLPGTTREALSEHIRFYKADIKLTDTPGVRRQSSVRDEELETLMVKSSLQAVRDADIVLLLIDASAAAIADQELKLAFYVLEQKKALIILFNKSDLMTEAIKKELISQEKRYDFLFKRIEKLEISCKTGKNVGKILPLVHDVWQRYSQTLPAVELEQLCKTALQEKPLYHKTIPLFLDKVRQIGTAPITILLLVNVPGWFGESQLAFFEHKIRKEFDLRGVPIKFVLRKRK